MWENLAQWALIKYSELRGQMIEYDERHARGPSTTRAMLGDPTFHEVGPPSIRRNMFSFSSHSVSSEYSSDSVSSWDDIGSPQG